MRKKYALVVGINAYPSAPLSGCVNDADDARSALKAAGYDVVRLVDRNATKANVVMMLQVCLGRSGVGDRFVFHFSGHGTWVPDQDGDEADRRDEALCLYDYERGGLLTDDELHRIFQARRMGTRVTIISDSCHSGTMARLVGSPMSVQGTPRFISPHTFLPISESRAIDMEQRVTPNARSRPGTVLVSGCQDHEYSYDANFNGRPNGAMTYHLLQSLKGGGSTRRVYERLRTRLPTPEYPQTPVLTATRSQAFLPFL